MTAAQLRLLRVFTLQFVTDAVKQLHVALLGILLERGDEGPRHGARCLAGDLRVLPTQVQNRISKCKHTVVRKRGAGKTSAMVGRAQRTKSGYPCFHST